VLNNNEIEQKLNELSAGKSDWRQRAEERRNNQSWLKLSARIAFRVLDELAHQGMTQVQLAEKLGITPQAVNKWLKGKENFTMESIFKLEKALGVTLLTVPKRTGTVVAKSVFKADHYSYGFSPVNEVKVNQAYEKKQLKLIECGEAA
jgi:transcriptional regulator with XRE-family HTH domain